MPAGPRLGLRMRAIPFVRLPARPFEATSTKGRVRAGWATASLDDTTGAAIATVEDQQRTAGRRQAKRPPSGDRRVHRDRGPTRTHLARTCVGRWRADRRVHLASRRPRVDRRWPGAHALGRNWTT